MTPTVQVKSDSKVAVNPDIYWIPVTHPSTPRGVSVWVIDKRYGVATRGIITSETTWTHWYPFPKFNPNEQ